MGRRDQATDPPPAPGPAAPTPGGPAPGARADQDRAPAVTPAPASPRRRRSMTGPGRARAVTGTTGPTSARWPHARTSPLFPITYLAAPRLTLAAQDCGGYTDWFWWGCCLSGNIL